MLLSLVKITMNTARQSRIQAARSCSSSIGPLDDLDPRVCLNSGETFQEFGPVAAGGVDLRFPLRQDSLDECGAALIGGTQDCIEWPWWKTMASGLLLELGELCVNRLRRIEQVIRNVPLQSNAARREAFPT